MPRYVWGSPFSGSTSKWRNRQTRQLEGLVLERGWGFKSPLRHDCLAAFPLVRALRRVWITRPGRLMSAVCQQMFAEPNWVPRSVGLAILRADWRGVAFADGEAFR